MAVTSPPYWGLRDYGLEPLEIHDPVSDNGDTLRAVQGTLWA